MAGKFLTFIAVLYSVTQVQAQTRNWDGSISSFWGVAGNWVEGSIPNSTTTVIIENELGANPDYFVDLRLNRTILGLELGGDNGFTFGNADDQLNLGSGGITTSSPSSGSVEHVFGSILNPIANSTWSIASGADLRLTGNMTGTNVITKTGSGNLILDYTSAIDFIGSHDFDGTYIIQDGEIQLETAAAIANETADYTLDGGALRLNSFVNFSPSTDFSVTSSNGTIFGGTINYTIDGDISGDGILTKRGEGRLTLTGDATNLGGFDIQAGTLRIGSGQTIGSVTGDLTTTGTAATIQFERSDDYTYSGQLSGNLIVTQDGSGKLTLAGSNTFTQRTLLTDGILRASNNNALGSNDIECLGGALEYADGVNIANDLSLFNDVTLNVLSDETATQSGQIIELSGASSLGLTKAGEGTLKLTALSTHSNGTTISAGTLQIGDGGTTGTITGDVTNNGTLAFNRSDDITFEGIISGSGGVTKAGLGDLTFSGANTYTGTTTIEEGKLIIAQGNTDALADSAVTINPGAMLEYNQIGNLTVYGIGSLAGSGNVETNSVTFLVTTDNLDTTFSGALTSSSGITQINKGGTGTWTLTGSGHNFGRLAVTSGTMVLDGVDGTIASLFADSQLIIKNTGSDFDVEDLSSSDGHVLITEGALVENLDELDNNQALTIEAGANVATRLFSQTSGSTTIVDEATLSIQLFSQLSANQRRGTIAISDSAGSAALIVGGSGANNRQFQGRIQDHTTGPGSVLKTGSNRITFSGANTYSGSTTIEAGTLRIGNAGALQNTTVSIGVNDGLDLDGFDASLGGLAGSGDLDLGSTALTLGSNGEETNYSGTLSGTGSLTKNGTGTLTLSGTNSFTGDTNLTDGILLTDNLAGSLVQTGGTFSPGESPATTTIGGGYTQQAGGALLLEIGGTTAGTDYDVLSLGSNSDLAGTITVQLINGFTPSFGNQFTVITSTATITDSGVSYNLPALSSGLAWNVTLSATSLVLEIGYSNDLDGFRAQYGLNPDGSDDALDWSGNGIANILYLVFGLGDPNEPDVDRTRLPAIEDVSAFADYALSFVQPKADVGLDIDLTTTDDLTSSFVDIDSLAVDYQPVATETESVDDDYERITEHFSFVGGEETRFYRINVNESE